MLKKILFVAIGVIVAATCIFLYFNGKRVHDLRQRAAELESQLAESYRVRAELGKRIAESEDVIKRLQQSNTELRNSAEQLREQNTELNRIITELRGENNQLRAAINSFRELQQRATESNQRIESIGSDITRAANEALRIIQQVQNRSPGRAEPP